MSVLFGELCKSSSFSKKPTTHYKIVDCRLFTIQYIVCYKNYEALCKNTQITVTLYLVTNISSTILHNRAIDNV